MKILVTCPCGTEFLIHDYYMKNGRGRYCSKACAYKNMKRPSGLMYEKHKDNPTSFKKGVKPWNAGLGGTGICKAPSGCIKKGEHRGLNTQFKNGENTDQNNINWKGDDVGYWPLHIWIARKLGKPMKCSICGTESYKRFHWHNISGEYRRDLSDWERLCPKCHRNKHIKKCIKIACL
jgi:hypothetical protein